MNVCAREEVGRLLDADLLRDRAESLAEALDGAEAVLAFPGHVRDQPGERQVRRRLDPLLAGESPDDLLALDR